MTRRRAIIVLTVIPFVIAVVWKAAHRRVAAFLAARLGDRLLRMSDGKFTDPRRFVEMRLADLALLAAGICLLALGHIIVVWCVNRRVPLRYHWVAAAVSAFVCLNISAVMASHTALFWCALFSGKRTSHNYTQYQIKSLLMNEIDAPAQAVLIGNSQTKAEIDQKLLNERLGTRLWTTELHFPGSRPYDVELSFSKLPYLHPKYVICYVTEGYFFSGTDSSGLIYFQNWQDLPEYYRLGGKLSIGPNFVYGLLGDTIPIFRLREPLVARLLGFHLLNLPQEHYNEALNTNLEQRAAEAAQGYHAGADAEFEKRAFVALEQTCRARGSKLVLCVGQMNPILGRALIPSWRHDMVSFLRQLAKQDDNIILLDENDLPQQSEADYEDLTHVNLAAQARFSDYLAGVLNQLMTKQPLAAK
jgi:hypothetical protein